MINFYQKVKKNQKGFTLVELMVVVVIIGILAAIAVPVYNGTQAKAKEQANKANIRVIEGAVQAYLLDNPDKDPKTDSGLNAVINNTHPLLNSTNSYLKEMPVSPEGYYYEIQGGKVDVSSTSAPSE